MLEPRPWPVKVTWRHRSRDDSIPHTPFPIGAPFAPRYLAPNISGSRPWPFQVTWRHRSRDDLIPHMRSPIGPPLQPSLCLQAFSRYSAPNVSESRPWPFGGMWPFDTQCSISYRCSIVTGSLSLGVFEIFGSKVPDKCKSSLRMRDIMWPVHLMQNVGTYFNFSPPHYLFTMTLLLGSDEKYWVFTRETLNNN